MSNKESMKNLEAIFNKMCETSNTSKDEVEKFFKTNSINLNEVISLIKASTVSPLLLIRAGFYEMSVSLSENTSQLTKSTEVINTKIAYALEQIKNNNFTFLDDKETREFIITTIFSYLSDVDFNRCEDEIKDELDYYFNIEEELSKPKLIHKDGKQLYVEDGKIKYRQVHEPYDEVEYPVQVPNQVKGYYGYYYKQITNTYKALFSNFNSKEEAREFINSHF